MCIIVSGLDAICFFFFFSLPPTSYIEVLWEKKKIIRSRASRDLGKGKSPGKKFPCLICLPPLRALVGKESSSADNLPFTLSVQASVRDL